MVASEAATSATDDVIFTVNVRALKHRLEFTAVGNLSDRMKKNGDFFRRHPHNTIKERYDRNDVLVRHHDVIITSCNDESFKRLGYFFIPRRHLDNDDRYLTGRNNQSLLSGNAQLQRKNRSRVFVALCSRAILFYGHSIKFHAIINNKLRCIGVRALIDEDRAGTTYYDQRIFIMP